MLYMYMISFDGWNDHFPRSRSDWRDTLLYLFFVDQGHDINLELLLLISIQQYGWKLKHSSSDHRQLLIIKILYFRTLVGDPF